MGTRSRIGLENEDGTIISVYCHWDGYPSHNGRILKEHYSNREKLKQLIELGDISVLAPEVAAPENTKHSFEQPIKGVTVFYGRDRGENNVGHHISPTRNGFLNIDYGEKYYYLFTKDNEWLYNGHGTDGLIPLKDEYLD